MSDHLKRFLPAFDSSRYANLAERFCENKLDGVEGNEVIFAALVISMAIRESSKDIENAIDELNITLDIKDTGGIEAAIEKLEGAVADVTARF